MKNGKSEGIVMRIRIFFRQLLCRHTETGIHSYPFRHRYGNGIRYGIYQHRVCLKCGKSLDRGHIWQQGLSYSRMKQTMRQLGHEGRAFAIKRSLER